MVDELLVGVIAGTHGIRGLVKVIPESDDPKRFGKLDKVTLKAAKGEILELEVTQARMHKGMVLIGFKGYEDINLVERFRGAELYVKRSDAADLGENEYYIADLVGMKVLRLDGDQESELGTIDEVMQTGANDVFVVKGAGGREILIPSIRDCITEVDVEQGIMRVTLLPGMEMV